jgi:hypothetical protein
LLHPGDQYGSFIRGHRSYPRLPLETCPRQMASGQAYREAAGQCKTVRDASTTKAARGFARYSVAALKVPQAARAVASKHPFPAGEHPDSRSGYGRRPMAACLAHPRDHFAPPELHRSSSLAC